MAAEAAGRIDGRQRESEAAGQQKQREEDGRAGGREDEKTGGRRWGQVDEGEGEGEGEDEDEDKERRADPVPLDCAESTNSTTDRKYGSTSSEISSSVAPSSKYSIPLFCERAQCADELSCLRSLLTLCSLLSSVVTLSLSHSLARARSRSLPPALCPLPPLPDLHPALLLPPCL